MKKTLEVCTDSVESAIHAFQGGADRIELCSNLVIGGTTPNLTTLRQIRDNTDLHVRILIRPRYGDYCYSEYEKKQMIEDVQRFTEAGADGVVIGSLDPDGSMDTDTLEVMIRAAGDKMVTLHRAFDVCRDPFEALELAVNLGADTILTSGQAPVVGEGMQTLKALQEKAGNRIEIMAGGGVAVDLLPRLIKETGIRTYHMSGKRNVDSRMTYRKPDMSFGLPERDEYLLWETEKETIQRAVEILHQQ